MRHLRCADSLYNRFTAATRVARIGRTRRGTIARLVYSANRGTFGLLP
jgi:hypothetical protein